MNSWIYTYSRFLFTLLVYSGESGTCVKIHDMDLGAGKFSSLL